MTQSAPDLGTPIIGPFPDASTDASRSIHYENCLVCADSGDFLRRLEPESVDCVVTSPPYYRQRDYRDPSQLGQEQSPEQYIQRLLAILREVQRVLAARGTLWLILGDKYLGGRLLGMPWRVALALQDDGWILRSDVIWHKPNAMPSAAKNRPTTDHEYVFFFTRSVSAYYYDADAVREPHVTFSPHSRMRGGRRHFFRVGGTPERGKNGGNSNLHDGRWDQAFHPKGRNKRTVWSVPLSKFRDAHFAVFPERLAETCVAAGCPPGGLVLDPFCGSGTTLVVARRLGRRFLGIDCNLEYCRMAQRRLDGAKG